jgi:hypothetical protein
MCCDGAWWAIETAADEQEEPEEPEEPEEEEEEEEERAGDVLCGYGW